MKTNEMILVADSGSTKTRWCLVDGAGTTEFMTEGYNPCYMNADYITHSLQEKLPVGLDGRCVSEIAFYGAGCYESKYPVIRDAMAPLFPSAEVFVAMDLLGSARSLLGREPGFAAILGTGTNTCIYDGEKITHNIDSLGFILGDEGSAGYMGKRLVGDFIRGYMPEEVTSAFFAKYQMTGDELIDRIYTGEMPNRFCADFTRFITSYPGEHDYLDGVVRDAFRDFFEKIVCGYPDFAGYMFNCVGKVGWIFREQLAETAGIYRMQIGKIVDDPMPGLLAYHTSKYTEYDDTQNF